MRGFVVVAAAAAAVEEDEQKKTVSGCMEVSLGQVFMKHD